LLRVAVNEAIGVGQTADGGSSEDACGKGAPDATDTVHADDIERVIHADAGTEADGDGQQAVSRRVW